MSIIAVEKKNNKITFIADTQMTYCDEPMRSEKIFETSNFIFGLATNNKPDLAFKSFLEMSKDFKLNSVTDVYNLIIAFNDYKLNDEHGMPESLKFGTDDQLLIADKDTRKVFYINPQSMTCYEIDTFGAIGSGANYAIGAYDAGASLEDSVKIACKRNIYCSEPLSTIEI